jgi:hypothetical protein
MSKTEFLNNESELAEAPHIKGPMICALVLRQSESEFLRLLRVIEQDFPSTQVIYRKVSIGPLWIMPGRPQGR